MTSSSSPARLKLLVFLHGYGTRGADLAPLAEAFARRLPGVDVACPDAPHAVPGHPDGRQWFSIAGITPENRAERAAGAAADVDAVLAAEMARHGVSEAETALIGFSQGTIISLDALTRGRRPLAIVGYAGRLARPPSGFLAAATRVLLVHGSADQVIPVSELAAAEAALRAAGADVRAERLEGVGHTISGPGAALGIGFLERFLIPA